jgi:hypothetical protein
MAQIFGHFNQEGMRTLCHDTGTPGIGKARETKSITAGIKPNMRVVRRVGFKGMTVGDVATLAAQVSHTPCLRRGFYMDEAILRASHARDGFE